jgi:hypothetical protein
MARCSPQDKLTMVRRLKEMGEVLQPLSTHPCALVDPRGAAAPPRIQMSFSHRSGDECTVFISEVDMLIVRRASECSQIRKLKRLAARRWWR